MQMHALVPLASKEEIGMSAFVIVESTVRDREPLGRYTTQAEPILRRSGGQTLVCGSLRTLCGKPVFDDDMICYFQNTDAALAWYNSAAYQAILDIRDAGLACRVRLVG
jgi:uncharacterized protein (DUF1330 family)